MQATKLKKLISLSALFRNGACLLALIPALSASTSLANEPLRPKSYEDLNSFSSVTDEEVTHVPGSRVAWADYGRILRDFPALGHDLELSTSDAHQLRDQDRLKLDQWLVSNFAFVGSKQRFLNGVRQSDIPEDPSTKARAFRPKGWVRSAVLEVRSQKSKTVMGMVDVKGFGHGARSEERELEAQVTKYHQAKVMGNPMDIDILRTNDHSDGLMSFGEAGAEVTRQRAVQTLLERKELPLETVESYAIIELPFHILKDGDQKVRAALYLRQAHFGREYSNHAAPDEVYIDPRGKKQATATGTIVDFGGVVIPHLALKSHFGHDETKLDQVAGTRVPDAQYSHPWAWAHQAAESSHPDAMRTHVEQMDAAVAKAVQDHPDQFEIPKNSVLSVKQRLELAEAVRMRLRRNQMEHAAYQFLSEWMKAPELSESVLIYLNQLLRDKTPNLGSRMNWFRNFFQQEQPRQLERSVQLVENYLSHPAVEREGIALALTALGNWDFQKFETKIQKESSQKDLPHDRARELLNAVSSVKHREALRLYHQTYAKMDGHTGRSPVTPDHFARLASQGHGSFGDLVLAMETLVKPIEEKGSLSACSASEDAFEQISKRFLMRLSALIPDQQAEIIRPLTQYLMRCGSRRKFKAGRSLDDLAIKLVSRACARHPERSDTITLLGMMIKHPVVLADLEFVARMKPWAELQEKLRPLGEVNREAHGELLARFAEVSRDDASYKVLRQDPASLDLLVKKLESKSFRPTPAALSAIENQLFFNFRWANVLTRHQVKKALLAVEDSELGQWILKCAGLSLDPGIFGELAHEKIQAAANSKKPEDIRFLIAALGEEKTRVAARSALGSRKDVLSLQELLKTPPLGYGDADQVRDLIGARLVVLPVDDWKEILPSLVQTPFEGLVLKVLLGGLRAAPSAKLLELVLLSLKGEERARRSEVVNGQKASPYGVLAKVWIEKGLVKKGSSEYNKLMLGLLAHYKWSHEVDLERFFESELKSLPGEPLLGEVLSGISKDQGEMARGKLDHYPWNRLATKLAEAWAEDFIQTINSTPDRVRHQVAGALAGSGDALVARRHAAAFQQLSEMLSQAEGAVAHLGAAGMPCK